MGVWIHIVRIVSVVVVSVWSVRVDERNIENKKTSDSNAFSHGVD